MVAATETIDLDFAVQVAEADSFMHCIDFFYFDKDFTDRRFIAFFPFAFPNSLELGQFVKKIIFSLFQFVFVNNLTANSVYLMFAYSSFIATLSYVCSIALAIAAVKYLPMS